MDDALTVARSQTAESQAARMIYSTAGLFTQFIKYVRIQLQVWSKIVIFKVYLGEKNPILNQPIKTDKPNQMWRPYSQLSTINTGLIKNVFFIKCKYQGKG